ncbi:recombinase family protein [Paenibacillus sp. FSL H8-0034]|uniref:recombinase family protein n=1 Tax=Paenibacillus sp. FSL H8-0034 TaxID=2954671 RepID=UPI0030FD05C7
MTTDKTKVAIYTRTNQAHEGVEKQLQELRAYCEANGKEIYAEYVDEGVSGMSMEGRHSLQRLLEDAKKQEFQEVIIWKINRLARNVLDVMSIIHKMDSCGVTLRSIMESIESSTPIGKFALQMMAAVTELELASGEDDRYDQQTC